MKHLIFLLIVFWTASANAQYETLKEFMKGNSNYNFFDLKQPTTKCPIDIRYRSISIKTTDALATIEVIRNIIEKHKFKITNDESRRFFAEIEVNKDIVEQINVWVERDFDNPMGKIKVYFMAESYTKDELRGNLSDSARMFLVTNTASVMQLPSTKVIEEIRNIK